METHLQPDHDIIALDHEETWPVEIVRILDHNPGILDTYEIVRLQRASGYDTRLTELREQRNEIISDLNGILEAHNVLGFQCTRLHPEEINHIWANGLEPLSAPSQLRRLQDRVAAGDINENMMNSPCLSG